ncbi:MAG: ORF6N domain-containing protein, partial [Paludibacter sp.]|nr:ORF6N domain-containing protein [Paludibacter sp.]
DYNDINEDTRTQLELINQTLAQLQSENKVKNTPRKKIGFY